MKSVVEGEREGVGGSVQLREMECQPSSTMGDGESGVGFATGYILETGLHCWFLS